VQSDSSAAGGGPAPININIQIVAGNNSAGSNTLASNENGGNAQDQSGFSQRINQPGMEMSAISNINGGAPDIYEDHSGGLKDTRSAFSGLP